MCAGPAVTSTPGPDPWIERLSQLSDQVKALLRRFQAGGLDSIIYLGPDEGPSNSLIEYGAVIRVSGAADAGDKVPYELSRFAKEALQAHPEIVR